MGIKRVVDVSFWTDGKVDDFSPEDKYFMLYLLTNPFTTQLGIYEISIKQAAFQMGYSIDAFNVLLDRFANKYNIIKFSRDTKSCEIAIKNFLRHSIIKGGAPVRDCLIKEIKKVKDKDLITWVFCHIKCFEDLNETVSQIIKEYEEKNGILYYSNEKNNENGNENDNEVSYHESSNDSPTNRKNTKFVPPSVDEVRAYCFERMNNVDPEAFVDFYTSKGWMVGKNKMEDWKAAVRTWEKSKDNTTTTRTTKEEAIQSRVSVVDSW